MKYYKLNWLDWNDLQLHMCTVKKKDSAKSLMQLLKKKKFYFFIHQQLTPFKRRLHRQIRGFSSEKASNVCVFEKRFVKTTHTQKKPVYEEGLVESTWATLQSVTAACYGFNIDLNRRSTPSARTVVSPLPSV